MNGSRNGSAMAAAGFAVGVLVGVLVWSGQMRRSRRDLFGASRIGRIAALGYLANHPSVETARVLKDYVSWEREPLLRRRGQLALRKVELGLRQESYHD